MNRNELVITGLAAVRARFQTNPDSMLRLFFDAPTSRKIGVMCKALAVRRKVYRCVDASELEAIAGTVHHGGIVAVVVAPELPAPTSSDLKRWALARDGVLVLDHIGNAHNLGALARSAAFFGVKHIVLPASPDAALPGEAGFRIAEGGLEFVTLWRVSAWLDFLKDLAGAGYEVVGAATRGGAQSLATLGQVTADRAVALVLGNEEHGLSPEVEACCTRRVTLPGSGKVESLNVSVAGAVLMWELFARPRQVKP